MHLRLTRWYSGDTCTLGTLLGPSGVICQTLELPWRLNAPRISCIPVGTYSLYSHVSPRFGKTLAFTRVVGRSGILFHAGNVPSDSEGCILPCTYVRGFRGYGSAPAVALLRGLAFGVTDVKVSIVSAY